MFLFSLCFLSALCGSVFKFARPTSSLNAGEVFEIANPTDQEPCYSIYNRVSKIRNGQEVKKRPLRVDSKITIGPSKFFYEKPKYSLLKKQKDHLLQGRVYGKPKSI